MDTSLQLQQKVAELIIHRCNLEDIKPDEVDYEAPIFISQEEAGAENGLELDSVDALEIIAAVKGEFGVSIDPKDMGILKNIRTLADYIRISQIRLEAV